jgi:hypothetical protein
MKSFVYAYAIGTSHMKEKINVFSVKDLARSSKIILWSKTWHQISRWKMALSGIVWNIVQNTVLEWDIGHCEITCENTMYATMIWMFDPNFVDNLRQAPGDNLWLTELTNQNYKICLLH